MSISEMDFYQSHQILKGCFASSSFGPPFDHAEQVLFPKRKKDAVNEHLRKIDHQKPLIAKVVTCHYGFLSHIIFHVAEITWLLTSSNWRKETQFEWDIMSIRIGI